ncbi:MAG TPA: transglycosylase family protein [Candidatus Limnocylindrales bacterium]
MPEVSGRHRAVVVAIVAAALVVSILPSVAASAGAPPGIDRFLYALGQVESGGNYYALNPTSGAYGKYQIMPTNWPGWALRYIGSSAAPQTPANQEKVARGKVTDLWIWLDTWPNVAHWWLTGSGERNQALWSSYSKTYVARIMAIYNATSDAQAGAAATPIAVGVASVGTRRIPETNAGIAYSKGWAPAAHESYASGSVLYSERDGASANYPFYARSVAWVGPVGATRGKARIWIDGVAVGVVDLQRSSFKARVTLFTKAWSRAGSHVLGIEVLGSGRPVAIDEFVITR